MIDAIRVDAIEDFVNEKMLAIHCETPEETYELIEYLNRSYPEIICMSSETLADVQNELGDMLCFDVWCQDLIYDSISQYRDKGYDIVEFSDVFAPDEELKESSFPLEYLIEW